MIVGRPRPGTLLGNIVCQRVIADSRIDKHNVDCQTKCV
jgi:hypothetical protein